MVNNNLKGLDISQPLESFTYLFQNTRGIGKHSAHSYPEFCGSCASNVPWPSPADLNVTKLIVHQTSWRTANEESNTTKVQSLSLMSVHSIPFHRPVSQHWLKNRRVGWGSLLQGHLNWYVRAKQTFEGKFWLLNYRPVQERKINRWEDCHS